VSSLRKFEECRRGQRAEKEDSSSERGSECCETVQAIESGGRMAGGVDRISRGCQGYIERPMDHGNVVQQAAFRRIVV
jgi:hypothetical protein